MKNERLIEKNEHYDFLRKEVKKAIKILKQGYRKVQIGSGLLYRKELNSIDVTCLRLWLKKYTRLKKQLLKK